MPVYTSSLCSVDIRGGNITIGQGCNNSASIGGGSDSNYDPANPAINITITSENIFITAGKPER